MSLAVGSGSGNNTGSPSSQRTQTCCVTGSRNGTTSSITDGTNDEVPSAEALEEDDDGMACGGANSFQSMTCGGMASV